MKWDRSLKKSLRALSKQATAASHQLTHVANTTYDSVTDVVDDTKHAADRFTTKTYSAVRETFEDAVDRSMHRIQKMAEERIENLATDIQTRLMNELYQRQVGIIFFCLSVAFGICSGLLLSFALVYCAVAFLNLPIWASFVSICVIFASTSFGCFYISKQHFTMTRPH